MTGIWLLVGCTALVATLGLVEAFRLRRNLRRLPIRVHVNGTRGKSSVTRLIAAGMRAGGLRTVAKTTGTLPRLILPDGSEVPIDRTGRANVIEQRDVASVATRLGAEALVVECMALQPRFQTLCESKFVRATHGVITNCRADHLDVMGPTERDVACALTNMTPVGGKLFTAECRYLDVLQLAATDRRSELLNVTAEDVQDISDLDMAGFRFDEHKENVALALRVCADLGVDRAVALRGMQEAQPDPGATTTHDIDFYGRELTFVNAFAANDPVSTGATWQRAIDARPGAEKRIAIVNCRHDRPDRSRQFAEEMVHWTAADHIVLVGSGTRSFIRSARKSGLNMAQLIVAEKASVAELFELIVDMTEPSAVVVGMGNIGDCGLDIARYFRNRSRVAPPALVELAPLVARRPVTSPSRRRLNGKTTNGHALAKVNGANGTTIASNLFSTNGQHGENPEND